ncbi:hypothetical protein niasHS_014279 [Heterodera schachtii]|uniref:Uncharacterized protein n=1 Tax=Heterodera schachtii TaxID=97005 RepID=A0ABD2I2V8_HETSC
MHPKQHRNTRRAWTEHIWAGSGICLGAEPSDYYKACREWSPDETWREEVERQPCPEFISGDSALAPVVYSRASGTGLLSRFSGTGLLSSRLSTVGP